MTWPISLSSTLHPLDLDLDDLRDGRGHVQEGVAQQEAHVAPDLSHEGEEGVEVMLLAPGHLKNKHKSQQLLNNNRIMWQMKWSQKSKDPEGQ